MTLSVAAATYLISHEVTNDFLWRTLAEVDAVISAGSLSGQEVNPGYVAIIAVLQTVLGLQGAQMVALPIGIVAVPFVVYAVSRSIMGSEFIAIGYMIYMATYIGQTSWFNIFAYVWSRPLYFLGLMLLVTMFFKLDMRDSTRYVAGFFIAFTALLGLHYTSGGWLIILVATILVIGALDDRQWVKPAAVLLVLMTILYLWLTQILYQTVLPSLAAHLTGGGTVDPVSNLAMLLESIVTGDQGNEAYQVSRSTPVYSRLRLLLTLLFAGVTAVAIPTACWRVLQDWRGEESTVSSTTYVFLALLATVGGHAVAYGIVFSISPQALIILGPLLGVLAIRQLGVRPQFITGFIVIVVALSTITMFIRFGHFAGQLERMSLIRPGAEWFAMHAHSGGPEKVSMTTPIHLRHYYQYILGLDSLSFVYYNPELYAAVIGDSGSLAGQADYVVVDPVTREEVVTGARISIEYQPLGWHESGVASNPDLNHVYSDGNSDIYEIQRS